MSSTIEHGSLNLEKRFLSVARGEKSEAFRLDLNKILDPMVFLESNSQSLRLFCSKYLGIVIINDQIFSSLRNSLLRIREAKKNFHELIAALEDKPHTYDNILRAVARICYTRSQAYHYLEDDLRGVACDPRIWVEFAFDSPIERDKTVADPVEHHLH